MDEFERLWNGSSASLFALAMRLTGDTDDAEDLLGETVLRALRSFGAWNRQTCFRSWTWAIMRRVYLRAKTRDERMPCISLNEF